MIKRGDDVHYIAMNHIRMPKGKKKVIIGPEDLNIDGIRKAKEVNEKQDVHLAFASNTFMIIRSGRTNSTGRPHQASSREVMYSLYAQITMVLLHI